MDKTNRPGCAVLLILLAGSASAQEPRVVNARLEKRSAATGLEKGFRTVVASQVEPAWIGYAVPMVSGEHYLCCSDSWEGRESWSGCGACRLESRTGGVEANSPRPRFELESSEKLLVLFRVEQRRVDKIRTFSEECELDAGGLPFNWLTDVHPAESVVLLASFVTPLGSEVDGSRDGERVGHGALAAIALHADAAADGVLEKFVAPGAPQKLRERTAFWLGKARGRRGVEVLGRLVSEDPSERVREKAVFGLYVSKQPQALDTIIRTARDDKSSHVRGQALFWLAQKAGKKAAPTIAEAIENDPETGVKKRAVFALSQLPSDEAIPRLIEVARTNRNPAVRRQAMFWLGQLHDPRALTFFEEVLKSDGNSSEK